MIHKNLDSITKEDIDALIDNEVQEQRTLDYKESFPKSIPGKAEEAKKEFRADVTSFANAAGGDIVYGIAETKDNGKKTGKYEVKGLGNDVNFDDEKSRLEQILRSGIEPQIPGGVRFSAPIIMSGDARVLVMRIPKSWASPHLVRPSSEKVFRVHTRNNTGKYSLDSSEIRSAFLASADIADRIRQFRDERLSRIIAGETPVSLEDNPKVVLHVVPYSAFDVQSNIDPNAMCDQGNHLIPPVGNTWDKRFNLDGFVTYNPPGDSGRSYCYCQVFRSGEIEYVDAFILNYPDSGKLAANGLEKDIIRLVNNFMSAYQALDTQPPAVVLLTLLGVRGYEISDTPDPVGIPSTESHFIDRDNLLLPDILVEDFQCDQAHVAKLLKPAFDALWNASNYPGSVNYDEQGEYKFNSS